MMRTMLKYVAIPVASYMVMSLTAFAQQRTYDLKTVGKHDDEVLGVFVNGDNPASVRTCFDSHCIISFLSFNQFCP